VLKSTHQPAEVLTSIACMASFFTPLIMSEYQWPFWLLGTWGLMFLSVRAPLDIFIPTAVLSFVCLWLGGDLSLTALYGGYVSIPLVAIAVYKKFLPKMLELGDKKAPTLFHILCTLFTIITFVMSFLWAGALEQIESHYQWIIGIPGMLALWMGTFLGVFANLNGLSAGRNQENVHEQSMTSFVLTAFDYWWVVVCQIGYLVFQGQDQMVFLNMLIVSFLPFSLYAWQEAREFLWKKRAKLWIHVSIGALSVFLVIPFVAGILYTLLGPWINREKPRGNS
jgi:hypothetical protein